MSDDPMPSNVIQALARVMAELPGIGRDETSQQGYRYRGIEAITAHAGKLLGKYGVVPVPRVIERAEPTALTVNGKPWTEDHLTIEYRLFGPGGLEDFVTAGPFHALGRDNSDKGINKCMTQAYKYMLLQVLCIGDSKDDADASPAAEADSHPQPQGDWFTANGWESEAEHDSIRDDARTEAATLTPLAREPIKTWIRTQKLDWSNGWTRAEVDELIRLTDLAKSADNPPGPTNPVTTPETPPPAVPAPASGDPDPLPAPDETTTALIGYVEGLKPGELGDLLKDRNAALSGTMDIRRARLCKLLLAEGWKPEGERPVSCSWCNADFRDDDVIVDGLHPDCRDERDAEVAGEPAPSML